MGKGPGSGRCLCVGVCVACVADKARETKRVSRGRADVLLRVSFFCWLVELLEKIKEEEFDD